MKENCVCVLVTPKKYRELYMQMNGMTCVYPPRSAGKVEYVKSIETIYNLPVVISTAVDEDIKYVTKEEYEEIRQQEIKQTEDFFKNYEPDYMWK